MAEERSLELWTKLSEGAPPRGVVVQWTLADISWWVDSKIEDFPHGFEKPHLVYWRFPPVRVYRRIK